MAEDASSIAVLTDVVTFSSVGGHMQHHDANPLAVMSDVGTYNLHGSTGGDCDVVRDIPRLVRSSP